MPPRLEWIEPDTGAPGRLDWESLVTGGPSSTVGLDLWNDLSGAGASDAPPSRLRLLARPQGSTTWQTSGLALLDLHGLQVRVLGGLGDLTDQVEPTGWQTLGVDRTVSLPDLPAGDGLETEWRVSLPAGAGTDTLDLRIRIESIRSEPLPDGVREIAGDGVLVGVGDPRVVEIVRVDGVPAADGVDTVTLPDVAWTVGGRPGVALGADLVLDTTDVNGDALQGEGGEVEAYCALVSLGADGLVVTKGSKSLSPLGPDARPTTPAGHLPWLLVERPADGVGTSDITTLAAARRLAITTTVGRALTVAPGPALVDGHRVDPGTATQLEATPLATETVWCLADGSLVLAGARPDPAALAVHRLTADASSITEVEDRRRWIGPGHQSFRLDLDATVGASATWWHAGPPDLGLDLAAGVGLCLDDDPSALGGTSGAWRIEVETVGGSAWWSDPADAPSIAHDATSPKARALPGVAIVPAGSLVRATVAEVPTGATPARLFVAFDCWDIPD